MKSMMNNQNVTHTKIELSEKAGKWIRYMEKHHHEEIMACAKGVKVYRVGNYIVGVLMLKLIVMGIIPQYI